MEATTAAAGCWLSGQRDFLAEEIDPASHPGNERTWRLGSRPWPTVTHRLVGPPLLQRRAPQRAPIPLAFPRFLPSSLPPRHGLPPAHHSPATNQTIHATPRSSPLPPNEGSGGRSSSGTSLPVPPPLSSLPSAGDRYRRMNRPPSFLCAASFFFPPPVSRLRSSRRDPLRLRSIQAQAAEKRDGIGRASRFPRSADRSVGRSPLALRICSRASGRSGFRYDFVRLWLSLSWLKGEQSIAISLQLVGRCLCRIASPLPTQQVPDLIWA